MRTTIFLPTAALVLCLAAAGCAAGRAGVARPSGGAAVEQTRAFRNGAALLDAIAGDDYPAFAACLANGPAAELTEADFNTSRENMHSQFGEIAGYDFLTVLETPLVSNLVWVVNFEREDGEGNPIGQELLFRVIQGEIDGETVIFSFGFL